MLGRCHSKTATSDNDNGSTLLSHVIRRWKRWHHSAGEPKQEWWRDEREIRVLRHVAQNEMGEKWWMTKLYSKCASGWHVTTNEDQLESGPEDGSPTSWYFLLFFCFKPLESHILALNFGWQSKHPFCIEFHWCNSAIQGNQGVPIARDMAISRLKMRFPDWLV